MYQKSVDVVNKIAILSGMAIEARKREGESGNALLYTFTRKVKRSGILKEVRHRKFHDRPVSRLKITGLLLLKGGAN